MNTLSAPQTPPIKRRIVYIDDSVQKWLLIALVALEIVLVAGALWLLYLQLSGLIEANLYRVHLSDKPRIYPLLLKTALIGLGGLIAINIVALWIAAHIWARHVNSIIRPFTALASHVEKLDFSEDVSVTNPHEVVALALTWRKTERQRLLHLREEIAKLDGLGELSDAELQQRARTALEAIRNLLP